MKNKYIESVVNFLNNTQGEIYDYQLRFMLLDMFDLDLKESDFNKKVDSGLWNTINEDIACDDSNNFIYDMTRLKNKIKED